jgi:LytS/YehU family sensor histidine kinase
MVRLSYAQHKMNNQLLTANISAELKSLKEQIKPHFLFNTLNNLYGLTKKDPEKASEVVMKLSQLMNYLLYSSNYQKVSILKEVDYIQDYLELEKIRYSKDLQISFHKRIENVDFQVPPLLLQPFIENAFKHGISKQLNDAWLQIDLLVDANEMNFKVVNSKPEHSDNGAVTGIGIENVSKRLNLIYPNCYRLKVMDEGQTFLVNLTIKDDSVKDVIEQLYENPVLTY